jgi:hypothetical protein
MTEKDIKSGLLSLEPSHPYVQALNALLDHTVEEEQDSVTIANLADGARHFNAGRLAHAKDFRGVVKDLIAEAKREAEEALAKAQRGT